MKKIMGVIVVMMMVGEVIGAGRTGAEFLKIPVGARASGLGGGYVGLAEGVIASYWNIGGLGQLRRQSVSVMHLMYVGEISYDYIGYGYPMSNGMVAGGYVGVLNGGSIDKYVEVGNGYQSDGSFSASGMVISGGIAKEIEGGILGGVSMKVVSESIGGDSGSGYGVDVGILKRGEEIGYGVVMKNILQGQIKEADLPMSIMGGVSYTKRGIGKDMDFTGVMDIGYDVTEGNMIGGLGGELLIQGQIFVRLGYRIGNSIEGISIGVGGKYSSQGIDYGIDLAYVPVQELGNNIRLSLDIEFGRGVEKAVKVIKKEEVPEVVPEFPFLELGLAVFSVTESYRDFLDFVELCFGEDFQKYLVASGV